MLFTEPCGDFKNASGVLLSPGFPYPYQDEEECIYTITVPENNIIKMIFSEFDLEQYDDCSHDFLEFADGSSEFSDRLWKLCGNESNVQKILFSSQDNAKNVEDFPTIMYSTQNKMWIRYITRNEMRIYCTNKASIYPGFTQIGRDLPKALGWYMNLFHHPVVVRQISTH